jgi:hypothetical protein
MPIKDLHDFQIELLQKRKDQSRKKQESDLRKNIFALAVESNRERILRIAVAKKNKAENEFGAFSSPVNSVEDEESDSDSSNEVEIVSSWAGFKSYDSNTQTESPAYAVDGRDKLIKSYDEQRKLSNALILALVTVIVLLIALLLRPSL